MATNRQSNTMFKTLPGHLSRDTTWDRLLIWQEESPSLQYSVGPRPISCNLQHLIGQQTRRPGTNSGLSLRGPGGGIAASR